MNLFTLFSTLFRRRKTIAKIVSPITKIITELDAHAAHHEAERVKRFEQANAEMAKSDAAAAEAAAALKEKERFAVFAS